MNDTNISMVRGDTLSFGMEFEGLNQDLDSAYFTAKDSYLNPVPLFQKSIGDGITKVETGVYRVRVAPTDTDTATPGTYYYDLQVTLNGDVFTIMKGTLTIDYDVTN